MQKSQGPGVQRSQGPNDQDISKSHSNTSLTLKKVHLVFLALAIFPESCSFCHIKTQKWTFVRDGFQKFLRIYDLTLCKLTLGDFIIKLSRLYFSHLSTALNKTFMGVDCISQHSRFNCIINYGTQIVSLKKSQSAANIWNFP